MNVREIGSVGEWDECEADWRRVTTLPWTTATVFQSWDWLRAWWRYFGGRRRLWILEFRDGGQPVGYAALYLPRRGAPARTVRFVGTGMSDYNDAVAAPGFETRVARAFWDFLGEQRRVWDWLDFQQVQPGAVLRCASAAVSGVRSPFRVGCWEGETCPFLTLPEDWEAFRRSLGKKLRGNVGYYDRALKKRFAGVEARCATPATLAGDMEALFALHQRRWNQRWLPGVFAGRRVRAFHQEVAWRLLEDGALRLHSLRFDGKVQAALYCFQFNGRCAYYAGGFEPEHARLSLGTVITARAIRHAIEADGARAFDFLRGDEPYKKKWGAQDRFNVRLSGTHGGARGALLAFGGKVGLRCELALKHRMHHAHGTGGGSGDDSGSKKGKTAEEEGR